MLNGAYFHLHTPIWMLIIKDCCYTQLWWLSLGYVLKCVHDLREELAIFWRQQNFVALAEKLSQKNFNAKFCSCYSGQLCKLTVVLEPVPNVHASVTSK